MTKQPPPLPPPPLPLSADDLIILANALNYMAHAISPGECSTLTGYGPDRVKELHGRIAAALAAQA